MDLSIIIVNYNVFEDVRKCIESINKYIKNISFEIIDVDNNSADKSIFNFKNDSLEVIYIPLETNFGFGHANNIGMGLAKGEYFLLVNPDILFTDNSIEIMLTFLKGHLKAGAAGPVQTKPHEGVEYYYTFFPNLFSRLMQETRLNLKASYMKQRIYDFMNVNIEKCKPFKIDWIIGSCLMIKREIYDTI